jgi:tetraacyldisaccharide 4'-kinase
LQRKKYILLYPLSLIYRAITGFRNFLYNTGVLKSREFDIPVICVGNITVGGTGKTPHSEYLISLLKQDRKVALLSRGYKRKTRGFRVVSPSMSPSEAGDEPLQICRKFPGITVAVDSNRGRGAEQIIEQFPGTEVIILDDGFQHRRITPGLTILLTDFNRLMIKDHMLPYGELRESVNNMYRSDIILVTKCPPDLSPIQRRIIVKEINKAAYQNLYFTSYRYGEPSPVFNASPSAMPDFAAERKEKNGIVLVTGIANPDPLREYLRKFTNDLVHLSFPDHHTFTEKDFAKITLAYSSLAPDVKFIITTEKDAIRIRDFSNIAENIKSSFWYFPLEVFFLNDDKKEFDNLIVDYVRKNKRNNRIS